MTKRKNVKSVGKCIFCGGGKLSKEHIWPQWAAALLRRNFHSGPHREEFIVRTQKTILVTHKQKERPGHVTTKKIRVVCMDCNNGWMSVLESSAQKIVSPLILGQRITLTPVERTCLAEWLTLKIMVGEQNQRSETEVVIPQADRNAFREKRVIPTYIRLWIARCISDVWCNAYVRHAALLSLTTTVPGNSNGKNVQTTAFGIGQLFAYATASRADGIDLKNFFVIGRNFLPLWPLSDSDIIWPPDRTIDDSGAYSAAMALDMLMKSPRTLWKPIPE